MTTEPAARRPSYRFPVLLTLALVIGLGGLVVAARALRPGIFSQERPHEQAELDTAQYLRPIETAADPRTGEVTAPFSGFAVSVETEPEDALVIVAGVPRGESPVLAGVDCKPGSRVQIRVEKAGFRAARATTTCRTDTLVKLTVRLVQ